MGFDIPDGPQPQMTIEVVGTTPTLPLSTTEYPIAAYGSLYTASDSYNTVRNWTVTANRIGVLSAVEVSCDNYAVAVWRLTIGGVAVFQDIKFPESFTQGFPDLRIGAGVEVLLEVKSDGATFINAYGSFDAKEVG